MGKGVQNIIETPLGAVLILIITLILAGLTVAASISGQLTAAAVAGAGLFAITLIIGMINLAGRV